MAYPKGSPQEQAEERLHTQDRDLGELLDMRADWPLDGAELEVVNDAITDLETGALFELLVVHDGGVYTVSTSRRYAPSIVEAHGFSNGDHELAKVIAKERAERGRWAFVVEVGAPTGPSIIRSYTR